MMNLCLVVVLTVFWTSAKADGPSGQLCSELVAGEPTNEADKRSAQLCQLAEMADVMENMAKVLGDGLTTILNGQGVTVDDDSAAPGTAGDAEKRKNEYLRFGKRKNEYLRFGKRKNEYLRFGKRKNEYLRFGK